MKSASLLALDLKNLPVASSETARHLNRRVILNLIRNRQPVSRADLARLSGLQRSTVSLIIEELIAEDWVVEGATGRLPRGRRPTYLSLNQHRKIVCIDLRPSKTFLAISNVNGIFESHEVLPTGADPTEALDTLARRIKEMLEKKAATDRVEGIGITVPGRLGRDDRTLVFAPNLKWRAVDLKTPIEQATGIPVVVENAANACVMAEMWFERREAIRNIVAITVSEGIGTGIVADGHLVRSRSGMAGEFGHFPLDPNGPECACGNRGCWEVYASEWAATRHYLESASSRGRPDQTPFDFRELLALAGRDDVLAVKALDRMARYLASGVRVILAGLAPEALVFVGDFTAAWSRFEPVFQEQLRVHSLSGEPVRILPARDHHNARLRGTVALVLQKHFAVSLPD